MRLLFIVPPSLSYSAYTDTSVNLSGRFIRGQDGEMRRVTDIQTDMPLGVLSIAAYCRKRLPGARFALLDFNVILNKLKELDFESFEALFESRIKEHLRVFGHPDIIGVSALFSSLFNNVVSIATICKSIVPSIPLTVGGGVATNQYRQLFQFTSHIDACCYGEGEIPMLDLLRSSDFAGAFRGHAAWITPQTLDTKIPASLLLPDLDEIPELDFSLCDLDGYCDNSVAVHISLEKATCAADIAPRPHLHVMTSRGCPNKCTFCASHSVHGRTMRYHSVERIRQDFSRYVEQYHPSVLVFQDDNFSCDRKRAFEILDFIKTIPTTFIFTSGLVMVNLDRVFLAKLKECGLAQITLPIESGSERVLKELMHKPLNRKIIERVVKDCREINLNVVANVIFGYPGETKADIDESVAYLKTLDVDWFYCYAATPLPGSDMYALCLEKGYIELGQVNESGWKRPIITTPHFTPAFIAEKVYAINQELNMVRNNAMRKGDYAFALQQFGKVFRVKEDHALCHFMCSVCHERMGETAQAGEHFASCRSILPCDPEQAKMFLRFAPQLREIAGLEKVDAIVSAIIGAEQPIPKLWSEP
jgi:radical SAM superfamily enzyme YgiQ (UPF0313 family)